jgi:hypothetical protein
MRGVIPVTLHGVEDEDFEKVSAHGCRKIFVYVPVIYISFSVPRW